MTDKEKLDPRQIQKIKKLVSRGATQRSLAAHYGVHVVTVNRIVHATPRPPKRAERPKVYKKKYTIVIKDGVCAHCEVAFQYKTWRNKTKMYCSNSCTSLASYYRRNVDKTEWAAKQIDLLTRAGLFVPKRLRDLAAGK